MLTSKQQAAVPLAAAGATVAEIAERIGVSRRTLSRWRALTAFQAAVGEAKAAIWSEALDRLRGLLPRAVLVLAAALDGEDRFRAAVEVLKLGGLGKATLDPAEADFEDRLEAVEEAMKAAGVLGPTAARRIAR